MKKSANRSYTRGNTGERKVAKILNKLNKGKYQIFNNIKLEYEDRTVEIDHLIVSNFGVYIIETKNISGKVRGNTDDKYWVKLKRHIEKFYNPINQNEIHIKAFKQMISTDFEEVPIYSIVVFINTDVETDATNVIKETELISKIHRLNKQHVTENTRERLVSCLRQIQLQSL